MKEQLTIDNATRTGDESVFFVRKHSVIGHRSPVKSSPRGFTLVETLVAISILLVAVVGPISLIGDALQKLYYARDEMIAINLAQEGIEIVRYARDSNMLSNSSKPWKDLNDTNTNLKKGYIIDAGALALGGVSNIVKKCTGGLDCTAPQPVFVDTTTGMYRQCVSGCSFSPTPFMRLVEIAEVNPATPDEREATVIVTWTTGGQSGKVVVSENLFKLVP